MNKLTILVDMDDTIENLCEAWVKCLNYKYNTKVILEDIKEWDMTKAFPSLNANDIFEPLFEEEFWKSVRPIPGAEENLLNILNDGHEIIIVTASNPKTVDMKLRNVLFRFFPFIEPQNVIVAAKKQFVNGDILIDDAPHNLVGGNYKGILFDAPHNRSFDEKKHGIVRARNWEEVYTLINEYAELKQFKSS